MEENISGQIDPNKDHFVVFNLVFAPLRSQITAHQLMHALEDHLAIGPLHVQNAFVAQHFGAINIDNGTQEVLKLRGIKRAIGFKDKTLDVIVVMVVVAVMV